MWKALIKLVEKLACDHKWEIIRTTSYSDCNRHLLQSPKERAEIDKATKIGVAEALSKIQLPKIVMTGGNGGDNAAMDAMGLKMMTDLVDKMSK